MNFNLKALLTSLTGIKLDTELETNLTDQNLPLEEYLKKPEAIQCFQDMSTNAQKYFDRNKIIQLVKYITEQPKEDEYNVGYKYPYVACEMLKKAPKRIQDMIILPEDEFNKIYHSINSVETTKENVDKENQKDKNESKENEENKNIDENKSNNENKNVNENKNDKKNQNLVIETQDISNIVSKKVKKEERKYNMTKRNDILDLLLDFITNKNNLELNDVLCGYFYQVLLSLMTENSIDIFLYLFFLRQDALEQIIMHSYQRSLSLLATNILKIEEIFSKIEQKVSTNPEIIDMNLLNSKKESLLNIRSKCIEKVITSIDLNGFKNQNGEYIKNDIDLEGIFQLLEVLSTIANDLFTNNDIITNHIFKILEENIYSKSDNEGLGEKQRRIYNYFIILLANILKNKKTDEIEKENFYPEFNYVSILDNIKNNQNLNFTDKLMIYIPKIISLNYHEITIPQKEEKQKGKLGLHNIYLMDLIIEYFNYTKNTPITFDFIILQSGFMDKSIKYFFTYQLNNIYHNKFLKLFTLYLQEAESHPLLTDYFFIRKEFATMLASFILKKSYKNEKRGEEYINRYEYTSGNSKYSCMHIYAIDLIYKIQAACGLKLLEEEEKNNLKISNFGYFEFIKDENTPNEIKPFKMPTYVQEILKSNVDWDLTIKSEIIPCIKIYEKKLIFSPIEIKPKYVASNSTIVLTNALNSILASLKSDKLMKKEDPNLMPNNNNNNNFTDVNFWKTNNTLSNETKNKVNENLNKNNSDNIDDEDELLNIAMKLEDKENNKNNNEKKSGIKSKPKVSLAIKNEISISSSNSDINKEKNKNVKNNNEIKGDIKGESTVGIDAEKEDHADNKKEIKEDNENKK